MLKFGGAGCHVLTLTIIDRTHINTVVRRCDLTVSTVLSSVSYEVQHTISTFGVARNDFLLRADT